MQPLQATSKTLAILSGSTRRRSRPGCHFLVSLTRTERAAYVVPTALGPRDGDVKVKNKTTLLPRRLRFRGKHVRTKTGRQDGLKRRPRGSGQGKRLRGLGERGLPSPPDPQPFIRHRKWHRQVTPRPGPPPCTPPPSQPFLPRRWSWAQGCSLRGVAHTYPIGLCHPRAGVPADTPSGLWLHLGCCAEGRFLSCPFPETGATRRPTF